MSKKCILLVRVSTEAQSFDAQEKEILELAIRDGYSKENITAIEAKESGIGLSEEERYGLQEMYRLLDTGEYDCVYAWEVSRIARTKKVLFSVENNLIHRGVQLIIKNPYVRLLKDDGTIDEGCELTFTLYAQLAEAEMRNKKDRFRRGKKAKAQQGLYVGANIPYGYRVEERGRDKVIVIDEEKAKNVRLVFDLYEQGISQTKMPKELERLGIFDISLSLVSNILNNEHYTGSANEEQKMPAQSGRGEWTKYSRSYPPIITQEQYDRCRQIAHENNTKKDLKSNKIYFGGGLLVCPECGGKFSTAGCQTDYRCYFSHLTPEQAAIIYKHNKLNRPICHNKTNVSINIIDSILWSVALKEEQNKRLFRDKKLATEMAEKRISELTDLLGVTQKRLDLCLSKKQRIGKAFVKGVISENELDQEITKCNLEHNEIMSDVLKYEQELSRHEETIDYYENNKAQEDISYAQLVDDAIESIRHSATDEEKSEMTHKYIEKVVVLDFDMVHTFKSRRIGTKHTRAKLIKVYTYAEKLRAENYEVCDYPYVFAFIPFDGKGGRTVMKYCLEEGVNEIIEPELLNNLADDCFKTYQFDYLCRYTDPKKERKKEQRRIDRENRRLQKENPEEVARRKEIKRKKRNEYAKKVYWRKKGETSI